MVTEREFKGVKQVSHGAFILAVMALLSFASSYVKQAKTSEQVEHGIAETLQNREETLKNRSETLKNRDETLKNREINEQILERLKAIEDKQNNR